MKKPSIADQLHRPHFDAAASHTTEVLPPDPAIPTRIKVTLEQVIPYANNPRKTRNPKYDEIKESIRNVGLDHAPNVTRQKPSDPYMILDGGNTRLQILNELWTETQDPKFFSFNCMFYPWSDASDEKSEMDILAKHLRENDMRGDMILIERALSAQRFKAYFEKLEGKSISIRELAKRICEWGWSVDQANLSQWLYAQEVLLPTIPDTLWAGMGRPGIKAVKNLLESCETFWNSVASPNEGTFDEIWKPVLTSLDGDGFDVEKAEYRLCGAMADRLDAPVTAVQVEIQAISEGRSKGGHRPTNLLDEMEPIEPPALPRAAPPKATPTPTTQQDNQGAAPNPHIQKAPVQQAQQNGSGSGSYEPEVKEQPPFQPSAPIASKADLLGLVRYEAIEPGSPMLYRDLTHYDSLTLKEMARDTAISYAKAYGIQGAIKPLAGTRGDHLGFQVVPYPVNDVQIAHWVYLHFLGHSLTTRYADHLLKDYHELITLVTDPVLAEKFSTQSDFTDALLSAIGIRSLTFGEAIRSTNTNATMNKLWEHIVTLEAISGVLNSRSPEEAAEMDAHIDDELDQGGV